MGHKWLDGKNWKDVTRTERYFVWKLASVIETNPVKFLRWINENTDLGIGKLINGRHKPANFEVATDVRFFNDYRRFANANPAMANHPGLDNSELDLVVFSPKVIVVFEAKSYGRFEGENGQLVQTRDRLPKIRDITDCKVEFVGIYSSKYSPKKKTLAPLSGSVTWLQIYEFYKANPSCSGIFLRADRCFQNHRNDQEQGLTLGYDLGS